MKKLAASALVAAFVLSTMNAFAKDVPVKTVAELTSAIGAAAPGDVIILADGTYKMTGVSCTANGTPAAPITVKAATRLAAHIELDALEGFKVSGASWHFEGLDIKGTCAVDDNCEHAFHVTGGATGFVMRNNRVFDFNAQLKVNASPDGTGKYVIPHGGLIEGNELADSRARNTGNPVTKLNIDTGDDWIVRANYIHDHHKGGGDNISYGAFMKSGGNNGVMERNLVICTRNDTTGGTRIGLSFGGGGTGAQYCAPAFDASKPCDPEHTNGTMRNNIIVACSDVVIYLNKSKNTHILSNTLIATSGVDFRFASTGGEARGNLLESAIRDRDGATHTDADNLSGLMTADFTAMYLDPLKGDLRKKGDLAKLLQKAPILATVADDYCARKRIDPKYDLGALESTLGDCTTFPPPIGPGTTPGDSGPTSDSGLGDSASSPDALDDSAPGSDSGAAGGDGSVDTAQPTADSGGCGCATPGASTSANGVLLLATAIAGLAATCRFSRRAKAAQGRGTDG